MLIKTENLTKVYKNEGIEVHALKGVNLEIAEGEMVSILGPSGSGKSTLLNCLSGIDSPTSGKVIIDGVDITTLSDDRLTEFRAKYMGFIFQFFNLIPVLNAVENVELPLLIQGYSEKDAREAAEEMLIEVGLKDRMKNFPNMLSGGEAQRVAIARALVTKPKIVWADEPTGALDTKTGMNIMNLIQELNEKNNQTFVIVTHDPRITEYTQKTFEMDSGILRLKSSND
ncbi:macrolide ABC transporter ATP-binding protein [Marinitoga sp. 1135]|uniref:ABC-type antimicrobial peptide transport system, ATPase component n=1 Tax=Marinitoga piezophila (strain DSM 14283 / JCM 11233 / KA3) TaxID=443254 RepID=H2J3D9_MARPK|nr:MULTISPECIES: ABC transporter ATP-binding protein [Marinitoga]AEX85755.1 ABC-type antimicrobial peptide transport system, ATPase component [Marinitoga piezophila KA3]APT76199.1 macrolide ABC transporter ATP-binding protein [Marinitoga sp. 1137]NUU95958.1 macrolide ABC transporter ATP-binding protein [Marinitoga sp. 1135]NUU97870.1 macrolide ABC transporter ATP-binding protein [Marinitoga sp. 1138]